MPTGKWTDAGLSLLLGNSATVFSSVLRVIKLYGNDFTPASGWVATDVDAILYLGTPVIGDITAVGWAAAAVAATGVAVRQTNDVVPIDFPLSMPDTLAYGYAICSAVGSSAYVYAKRFAEGPLIVNADTIMTIRPKLYLRNSDVSIP